MIKKRKVVIVGAGNVGSKYSFLHDQPRDL